MEPLIRDCRTLFGEDPRPLQVRQLPRIRDILLAVSYFMLDKTVRTKENSILRVTDSCIDIYSSIAPDIGLKQRKKIVERLRYYWGSFEAARKEVSIDKRTGKERLSAASNKKTKGQSKVKFNFNFLENTQKLFDAFNNVPVHEKAFVADQEGPRQIKRSPAAAAVADPPLETETETGLKLSQKSNVSNYSSSSSSAPSNSQKDLDYIPEEEPEPAANTGAKPKKKINESTLAYGDRFKLSNAALCKVVEKESGRSYTEEGLRLARNAYRKKSADLDFSQKKITVVGFDEKDDSTVTKDKSTETVEHCSVVLYDDNANEYHAGFFIPENKTASAVASGLLTFLISIKVNLAFVIALCSDGCPKMLGHSGGVHFCFEKLLGRSFQRCICLFHSLEKYFSWMFRLYGGETKGPASLKPPWSSLVLNKNLEDRKVNENFQQIPNYYLEGLIKKHEEAVKELKVKLSKDHEIFLQLVLIIITGIWYDVVDNVKVPKKALKRKIGPVVGSRFTTLETRILRAYLSEISPSSELVRMTRFLILVWAPAFFLVKLNPYSNFAGPRILLYFVMSAKKYLSISEIAEIEKGINYNPYMLCHENIALCLLSSEEKDERIMAVNKILELRKTATFKIKIANGKALSNFRTFNPSTDLRVNMSASSLYNLNSVPFHLMKYEPPATQPLSTSQIIEIYTTPLNLKLPLSTVAVERAVKDTSRAALMSHDEEQRRGIIQATIASRAGDRRD